MVKFASRLAAVLIVAVSLGIASPGFASVIGDDLLVITATNEGGTGTWHLPVPAGFDPGAEFTWDMANPITIRNASGDALATVEDLSFTIIEDPAVTLNFSVTANPVATHFTIFSPVNGFAAILNGLAYATAAITVTDNDGDGAWASGQLPGPKSYEASYNGGAFVFADLVNSLAVDPDDSSTSSERYPAVAPNRVVVPGLTSSIQSQFDFILSANDQASGTSRFDIVDPNIVPEPTSVTCLLFAAGLLARRRRAA